MRGSGVYDEGRTMTLFSRFSLVPLLLTAALSLPLLPSCQQSQKTYPVFFLTENRGAEEGAGFIIKYGPRYYTRLPMLSLEHFEKFRSFLNADGSYGVELFVKKEYRTRLYTETMGNVGKHMLPVVNGFAFAPMKIDRPITDGELVIWGGLNGYDLRMISRTVKPIDEELEKKRYKKENPRKKPEMPKIKNQSRDLNDRTIPELYASQS